MDIVGGSARRLSPNLNPPALCAVISDDEWTVEEVDAAWDDTCQQCSACESLLLPPFAVQEPAGTHPLQPIRRPNVAAARKLLAPVLQQI